MSSNINHILKTLIRKSNTVFQRQKQVTEKHLDEILTKFAREAKQWDVYEARSFKSEIKAMIIPSSVVVDKSIASKRDSSKGAASPKTRGKKSNTAKAAEESKELEVKPKFVPSAALPQKNKYGYFEKSDLIKFLEAVLGEKKKLREAEDKAAQEAFNMKEQERKVALQREQEVEDIALAVVEPEEQKVQDISKASAAENESVVDAGPDPDPEVTEIQNSAKRTRSQSSQAQEPTTDVDPFDMLTSSMSTMSFKDKPPIKEETVIAAVDSEITKTSPLAEISTSEICTLGAVDATVVEADTGLEGRRTPVTVPPSPQPKPEEDIEKAIRMVIEQIKSFPEKKKSGKKPPSNGGGTGHNSGLEEIRNFQFSPGPPAVSSSSTSSSNKSNRRNIIGTNSELQTSRSVNSPRVNSFLASLDGHK